MQDRLGGATRQRPDRDQGQIGDAQRDFRDNVGDRAREGGLRDRVDGRDRDGDPRDRIDDRSRDRDLADRDGRDRWDRDGRDRDRDRDHDRDWDRGDRDRWDRDHDHGWNRWSRWFYRPGRGWWFWRWNPTYSRYYQYYDPQYYGRSYAYGAPPAYSYYDDGSYGEGDVVQQAAALGVTFDQNLSGGAYIAQVVPGSPADSAGLRPGDVIVGVNNGPISDYQEVMSLVSQSYVGDRMVLEVLRAGRRYSVEVVLESRYEVFEA